MRWWKEKENEVYQKLIPLIEKLVEVQTYRSSENVKHVRLYGNLDILGLSSALYARPNPLTMTNRLTLNVVQSCVDTAAAKIAKNRPRPTFLTDGGDWELQQKAKKLEKFVNGQFYESRTYEETARCFVDGGVLGTGLMKVFSQDSQVCNERVLQEEIIVDDAEAMYGKPRSIYQRKAVARDVLKANYPEHSMQIDELRPIGGVAEYAHVEHADLVEVIEAWHLRSGKKEKDGRHVICIKGADLFDETWNKDHFPFAKFAFNPRIVGWYGQGIAEQLVGIQVEINKILRNIQLSQHLNSAPTWLVENNSKVVSAHINNEIGHIVKYTGIPPELRVFATMHPEIYQQLERLYQKAFEIVGISQLSAQAQKPAGLDSGKALREYNDIESERFVQVGQRWEQFHMDIARLHILEAKSIYKRDPDYSVNGRSKKFIQTIKWQEVEMPDDKYQMQIFPTSSLPQQPAGRLAYVQEIMQSGMIDPDTGLELLDFPDLQANNSLRFAARDVARETVNLIIEDGIYRTPEPFDDLKFLKTYAQMSYNYARIHNCPEDRLELLRRLIETCVQMLGDQQPESMGQMDPMMMAQMAQQQQMPQQMMPQQAAMPIL